MKPILFRGANVWDGSGAPTFPGDVLVEGSENQDHRSRTGPSFRQMGRRSSRPAAGR